ncbi:MAG: hypothetical protein IBX64_13820, partial [Actinobacteria bacterium]|nr:hypothetical protein [Actinomycetota bacterium]
KNSSLERYILRNGRLKVLEESKTIWESPRDWWVDDFVLADSTGDGVTNINLSVWRAGDLGKTKPFWVEENDQSIKNHFFVLKLDGYYKRGLIKEMNLILKVN